MHQDMYIANNPEDKHLAYISVLRSRKTIRAFDASGHRSMSQSWSAFLLLCEPSIGRRNCWDVSASNKQYKTRRLKSESNVSLIIGCPGMEINGIVTRKTTSCSLTVPTSTDHRLFYPSMGSKSNNPLAN